MKKFLTSFTRQKIRLTTLQMILLLTMSVLIPASLVVTGKAVNKPAHPKQHRTQGDFWNNIRMKPVKVTSVDGSTFYWKFEDTNTIELGSFVTDEITQGEPAEGKTFIVIYCEEHKVAYRIVPLR